MKIMSNLTSARLREETPHSSDALKRRAQSIINDKSIDAETRAIIRYGLEINDPWLENLVRCVNAGETIIDNLYVHSSEGKLETLTDLICRGGGESSAALLVYCQRSKTPPIQKPSQTPRNTLPSLAAAS